MATYTVKAGDTLSGIAQTYNTTVDALLTLNPKITGNDITKIKIKLQITALILLILKISNVIPMTFSNTAIRVDRAAKNMNRKNTPPQN